jgi:holliday junction DNA helicase RuvB
LLSSVNNAREDIPVALMSYSADSSSKAGMMDYLLTNKPRYLLVDEIDKMTCRDQVFLLNLMETGIVSETKYGKNRSAQMKTSLFATSNNIKKLSDPLKSRFFIVELEPYTYEQFLEITNELLSHHKIERGVANIIANAVWNKSQDIRDCVRIGKLARSVEDVGFVVDTFLGTNRMIDE